jgi:hypothetical protein
VFGPPQQFQAGGDVDRLGIGVVAAQPETRGDVERCEGFDALGRRLADIDVGAAEAYRVERRGDQVLDVIVEESRAEARAIVEQRLLEAGVIAEALFRLQVRIGEEPEVRKADEELIERRGLEGGADAGLELGFGPRDDDGRSDPVS